jgi:hypothetical protein
MSQLQQHSQRPERIEKVDDFVKQVLAVQDSLRIDDDLEELRYVVFSGVANRLVKFSGLFNNEGVAIERAKKVSMDGLFTTAVAPVGKWTYFGKDLGQLSTADAVRRFADVINAGIDAFEKRLTDAKAQAKAEAEAQAKAEAKAQAESGDLVDTVDMSDDELEEPKEPEPEEPVVQEPDNPDDKEPGDPMETEEGAANLRRMKLAITRGDVKEDRIPDQRFVVIGHGKIAEDECLFRVVGSYETETEAERAAKKAFDTDAVDLTTKRFDYVVARQFAWHSFPINFARDVEKTTVESNKDLEEYYKGEMYKRSDEYKMAVREIEETSKQMAEAAKEREEALQNQPASQTDEKNSLAITSSSSSSVDVGQN